MVSFNTAYRGASFSVNVTGAMTGTFMVTVLYNGTQLNSSAIPFNGTAVQLCGAMSAWPYINGCNPGMYSCHATSVRHGVSASVDACAGRMFIVLAWQFCSFAHRHTSNLERV